MRAVQARVLAAVTAAVLLGGCGMSTAASQRSTSTETSSSPTQIYGARTGAGGRSLVVGYEAGGCGGVAHPSSRETATTVTVTVSMVVAGHPNACPAVSQPRTLVVALAAPFAKRRLIDGGDAKAVAVFDGSRLLHPTVFPDQVSSVSDAAPTAGGGSGTWTLAYRRPRPDSGCTTVPEVFLTQGVGVGSIANDLFTAVPGPHQVAGQPAQFLQDPGNPGWYYLEWQPRTRPGWKILVQAEQACRGGPHVTTTDLLKFANSLR